MSLPPGFLDELRTRTSLSQVVGRKVTWDQRKSNQGKGDMWAPCPFHQEKTASFHVDDRKGFYYCFGCHAKGDAIGFVKDTENVSFMEAVEILAREAGMQMPARDPKAQEISDHRAELAKVMEQAVQFFRLQLKTAVAAPARDYLAGRGFDEKSLNRWEIGFAPDAWQGLWDHLKGKGIADQLILDAGLAKPSNKGGKPYDTFRNRIIFPICDARGRAIAFGGRAMDPTDNAKYLNSPETALFDKGRSLYNQGPAREAAGKGQPLIVGEGYMDVIALSEAGFTSAVAPLGTAITEDQLRLMWRIHPEPIIALDGDTAGLRAAFRLIDLAMPMLEPGQSLRFALLPQGMDPDDLIRSQGKGAMQKVLDDAQPLVRLLWRRETEGKNFDSPERRAGLDRNLRTALGRIKDGSVRSHYGHEIKALRETLFRPQGARQPSAPWRGKPRAPQVLPETRGSTLVTAGDASGEHIREAVILGVLIRNPARIVDFESDLENLHMTGPGHAEIQNVLLHHGHDAPDEIAATIAQELGAATLEKLFARPHLAVIPAIARPGDNEAARLCLAQEFAKLKSDRGAAREIAESVEDIIRIADEGVTFRLSEAARAREAAHRGQTEDKTVYDVADSGALIDRDERQAFARILQEIEYGKKK